MRLACPAQHQSNLRRREGVAASRGRLKDAVAADERVAPRAGGRSSFASAAEEQPHRGADATAEHESNRECADQQERELGTQLRVQVRRLAEFVGTGGTPLLIDRSANRASVPARSSSAPVTVNSASQVARTVASAAGAVAKAKPSAKSAKSAAPTPRPMPTASAAAFCLSSSSANRISSRASALACSATPLAAEPTLGASGARVGMPPPVQELRGRDTGAERGADQR